MTCVAIHLAPEKLPLFFLHVGVRRDCRRRCLHASSVRKRSAPLLGTEDPIDVHVDVLDRLTVVLRAGALDIRLQCRHRL